MTGLFGGVTDTAALTRSPIPFGWGAGLDRLIVSISVGLGFGIVVASVLADRRNRQPVADPAG